MFAGTDSCPLYQGPTEAVASPRPPRIGSKDVKRLTSSTRVTFWFAPKQATRPPSFAIVCAKAVKIRSPMDARKFTCVKSITTARRVSAIAFILKSTTAAPAVSMRPLRWTKVIPLGSSSVLRAASEISMSHTARQTSNHL
jgi:hypothetical protein